MEGNDIPRENGMCLTTSGAFQPQNDKCCPAN